MARLVVLRAMGDYEAAMQEAQAVLRVQPGHAQAKTYLGMLRLHMGHADGWQLYRNRWDTPAWTETMHYPKEHVWDGRIQPNTTVLFWAEQGFGDSLQFVRYLPWLQQQGLQLQLQCPEPLQALFAQTLPQVPIFQPQPGSTSAFDAHLPLLDLPSLLPNFNPAFCNAPYLHMASAPAHTRGTGHTGVRVGMVWAGRLRTQTMPTALSPRRSWPPCGRCPVCTGSTCNKASMQHLRPWVSRRCLAISWTQHAVFLTWTW